MAAGKITLTLDAGRVIALRRVLGTAVERLLSDEKKAQRASDKASRARANLPAGSSRPRVTTANARWAMAAEERDRVKEARELAEQLLHEVATQ
jgi:hypothetical protein